MKYLTFAIASLVALPASQAVAQTAIYNTILSFGTAKQYHFTGAGNGFSGDLFVPGGAGPVREIEVAFVNTAPSGGSYYVTATVWNDAFVTPAGSVTGLFSVPPLTPPHTQETWVLTFSPVNIPLAAGSSVYGVSFNTVSTLVDSPSVPFSTLYSNRATTVGTDYAGYSIDTNLNGVLEPYLAPPNQEWYNASPTWTHGNLLCALYEWSFAMAHGPSADETPKFTMRRLDVQAYRLEKLAKAIDPLRGLR